jgi:magnesium transporter
MRKISAGVALVAAPTLIAGVYGMNFEHMPELHGRWSYYILIGTMAAVCLVLYWKFKKARWL